MRTARASFTFVIHWSAFSDANFRLCASGTKHLILIDRSGIAWSWGKGPQTGRIKVGDEEDSDSHQIALTRIDFFQVIKSRDIIIIIKEYRYSIIGLLF